MAKKEKEYRRLPGRGLKKGAFLMLHRTRATLYAGKDHILAIYNSIYEEEYHRFYYKDIQAFIVRKTPWRDIWTALFLLPILFFVSMFFIADPDSGWRIFNAIFVGLFAVLFLGNLMKGPTAVTSLQTATSREDLPSLGRLKNAQKAIEILRPLITGAQGEMPLAEISDKAKALALEPRTEDTLPAEGDKEVNHYSGTFHRILFYLLLLNGSLAALHIIFHPPGMVLTEVLFRLAILTVLIISLVRQSDSRLPKSLKGATWTTLGSEITWYFSGFVFNLIYAMNNQGNYGNSWQIIKWVASLAPEENPVLIGFLILSSFASLILGGLGFLFLSGNNAGNRPSTSLPEGKQFSPAVSLTRK